MLIIDFVALEKKAEKYFVKSSVAPIIAHLADSNFKKTREIAKKEMDFLKGHLNNNAEKLTANVKGKFGSQAYRAIEYEIKRVDNF